MNHSLRVVRSGAWVLAGASTAVETGEGTDGWVMVNSLLQKRKPKNKNGIHRPACLANQVMDAVVRVSVGTVRPNRHWLGMMVNP